MDNDELVRAIDRLGHASVQAAIDAAKEISLNADKSAVPLLIQKLSETRTHLEKQLNLGAIDVAEERRLQAIELAILSLLPPSACGKLLHDGTISKRFVELRINIDSVQNLWEPISD